MIDDSTLEEYNLIKNKRLIFWYVIIFSLVFSLLILSLFLYFPTLIKDTKNPLFHNDNYKLDKVLVAKLKQVSNKNFVYLSQHGYTHDKNLSKQIIEQGYKILIDEGLNISFYTPPLEDELLNITPVPILKARLDISDDEHASKLYTKIHEFNQGQVLYAESTYGEQFYINEKQTISNYTIQYNYTQLSDIIIEKDSINVSPYQDKIIVKSNSTIYLSNGDIMYENSSIYEIMWVYDLIYAQEDISEIIYYNETYVHRDRMAIIHIQDDISHQWLEEIFAAEDNISILRIDDLNTNYVEGYGQKMYENNNNVYQQSLSLLSADMVGKSTKSNVVTIEDQIQRIDIATEFCEKNGCTLVLSIIPYVDHLSKKEESSYFISKLTIVITMLTLLPIYIFYIVSYIFFRERLNFSKSKLSSQDSKNIKKEDITTSVLIPMFNEENIIYSALKKNLEAFDCSDLNIKEIIIVNDCSTDNSVSEVQRFIDVYNGKIKIRLVNLPVNLGKSKAVKIGLDYITQEYVLMTDSDSYFFKEDLKKMRLKLSENSSIVGNVVPYESNLLSSMQAIEYKFEQKILRAVQKAYNNPISIPGPFYLVRRDYIKKIDFEDSIVEDFKIGIELNKMKNDIYISPARVFTHPPLTWKVLRKQRLRWFGGIIDESIKNKDVWNKNGFYLLNLTFSFGSFFYIIFSLISLFIMLFFSVNKLNIIINLIGFFFIFNIGVALLHLFVTKKWSLKLFIFYPYYMMFLFIIRTEVIFRLIFDKKIKWGTR